MATEHISAYSSLILTEIKEYYKLRNINTDWMPLSHCSSVMQTWIDQETKIVELFEKRHNEICLKLGDIVVNVINKNVLFYNISRNKNEFIKQLIQEIDSKIYYRCK